MLASTVYGLGVLAVLLAPVLPQATARLWAALGGTGLVEAQRIDEAASVTVGARVSPLETSLFPRIEDALVE